MILSMLSMPNFNGVLIKDFVVLTAGGEVFGDKSEE